MRYCLVIIHKQLVRVSLQCATRDVKRANQIMAVGTTANDVRVEGAIKIARFHFARDNDHWTRPYTGHINAISIWFGLMDSRVFGYVCDY